MSNSKENAFLYYCGFIALKDSLDRAHAKSLLSVFEGENTNNKSLIINPETSEIMFLRHRLTGEVIIRNGSIEYAHSRKRIDAQTLEAVKTKFDKIYTDVIDKTIFYNYGKNDSVRVAFKKALLSEVGKAFPGGIKDIIINEDVVSACSLYALNMLSETARAVVSDTALIHQISFGFKNFPDIFQNMLAVEGVSKADAFVDHNLLQDVSLNTFMDRKPIRYALISAGALLGMLYPNSLQHTNFWFVDGIIGGSYMSIITAIAEIGIIKRRKKQIARTLSEQTACLSAPFSSITGKAYLIGDDVTTKTPKSVTAQNQQFSCQDIVDMTRQVNRLILQRIADTESENISINDVLGNEFKEMHEKAFLGMSPLKLFDIYKKEDVYKWFHIVNSFFKMGDSLAREYHLKPACKIDLITGALGVPKQKAYAYFLQATDDDKTLLSKLEGAYTELLNKTTDKVRGLLCEDGTHLKFMEAVLTDANVSIQQTDGMPKSVYQSLMSNWTLSTKELSEIDPKSADFKQKLDHYFALMNVRRDFLIFLQDERTTADMLQTYIVENLKLMMFVNSYTALHPTEKNPLNIAQAYLRQSKISETVISGISKIHPKTLQLIKNAGLNKNLNVR